MNRLLLVLLVLILGLVLEVKGFGADDVIYGPGGYGDIKGWRKTQDEWKNKTLGEIGFNRSRSVYEVKELEWIRTTFIQPQMMAMDLYFYDDVEGVYTVERYLNDVTNRYGGIDSVLVWQSYTNLGIDNRNQFDLIRGMPGGVNGVGKFIEKLHQHNVKVLFPYNPWDQGTRYEGTSDEIALNLLWKNISADGFNGDTMTQIPFSFYNTSLSFNHPLAMEPEGGVHAQPIGAVNWDSLAWGESWPYPFIPTVPKLKYLVMNGSMINVVNRWATDHTDDLQYAFFAGIGFVSWENVWGFWNQMTDRDAHSVKVVATLLRALGERCLQSEQWLPYSEVGIQWDEGVFVSEWLCQGSNATMNGAKEKLYFLINRSDKNMSGLVQLRIDVDIKEDEELAVFFRFVSWSICTRCEQI